MTRWQNNLSPIRRLLRQISLLLYKIWTFQRFRKFRDNLEYLSKNGVICFRCDGAGTWRVNAVNAAFLLGMNAGKREVIGSDIDELIENFIITEDASSVKNKIYNALENPKKYRIFEVDFIRKKRKRKSIRSISFLANQTPFGVIFLVQDTTVTRRLAWDLEKSEEKYRRIIENIEDGYFEISLRGDLIFFNESFRKIIGYFREELMGINYRLYMDAENSKIVRDFFKSVYKTHKPQKSISWEIRRRDGKKRYVESSITLILSTESNEPSGFQGILRDVTEMKLREIELRESKEFFRDLFETIYEGVFIHDENEVIYANPSMLKLIDYNMGEVLGQNGLSIVVPEYHEKIKELHRSKEEVEYEAELIHKDGSRIPVIVKSNLIQYRGKMARIIALWDISIQKRHEEELKKLAFVDELTSAFTLRVFNHDLMNAVKRARRTGRNLSLFTIDVNNLKEVNDKYTHSAGDELLIKVVESIEASIREVDKVFRVGGDEFTVIVENIENAAENLAKKIISEFKKRALSTDKSIPINASIGYTILDPSKDKIEEIDETMTKVRNESDLAMYLAKRKSEVEAVENNLDYKESKHAYYKE